VLRDIAVWVPLGTPAHSLEGLIRRAGGALLRRVSLFDAFMRDNRQSYAFRLAFQSSEKTLTDAEVNVVMSSITRTLGEEKGFLVR
jgi:phenylalanyl-tRNA synthetase beta chain